VKKFMLCRVKNTLPRGMEEADSKVKKKRGGTCWIIIMLSNVHGKTKNCLGPHTQLKSFLLLLNEVL
jgi:hypothetical protein